MPVHVHTHAYSPTRVLSGNGFLEGEMVRGKYTLGRGMGPSPQENVSVPLSEHIYSSMFTGTQELTLCHNLKLQLGKKFLGGAGVFGGEASPPVG